MTKDIRHIHMLGICGTGMGSLAGLLKAKGYQVTGSDKAIYPPMSTQLKNNKIDVKIGYSASNLKPKPDLAIIGNVIRKTNEEAEAVLDQNIPYHSMPEAVAKLLLKDKESVVVTGTHGKTTTANIIAWLLEYAKEKPSFLIGGVGLNFDKSSLLNNGKYFVIEGDEYDTAFFDKTPKFLKYNPKYAIIGSIEFDHADIYSSLDHIKSEFKKFIGIIPKSGICAINADSKNTLDISKNASCKVVTYGVNPKSDYKIETININSKGTEFRITSTDLEETFLVPLYGVHNISNTAAALTILVEMGINIDILKKGLAKFRGVKRRQEIRGEVNSVTVIDDFAHHPTAIAETVLAMKKKYEGHKVWAIFEPRSNTTRRNVFADDIAKSLSFADEAIIANVFHTSDIPENERLDPEKVAKAINLKGAKAAFINTTDKIIDHVMKNVRSGDILLIMSNGAFDNIHERLLDKLRNL